MQNNDEFKTIKFKKLIFKPKMITNNRILKARLLVCNRALPLHSLLQNH